MPLPQLIGGLHLFEFNCWPQPIFEQSAFPPGDHVPLLQGIATDEFAGHIFPHGHGIGVPVSPGQYDPAGHGLQLDCPTTS